MTRIQSTVCSPGQSGDCPLVVVVGALAALAAFLAVGAAIFNIWEVKHWILDCTFEERGKLAVHFVGFLAIRLFMCLKE